MTSAKFPKWCVLVWVCTYQFEGEPLENKKGTFVDQVRVRKGKGYKK